MASWVDRWQASWFDACLAALLVTGFTALAMIQCRQPVRRRHWGRLGLMASLLLIPLVLFSPLPRVDLRHPSPAVRDVALRPSNPPEDRSRSSTRPIIPKASSDREAGPDPEVRSSRQTIIRTGLLLAYLIGLILGLGRLGLGLVGSHVLIARSQPASPWAQAILPNLPYSSRLHRRPSLRVSGRIGRPTLFGLIRPTILIPEEIDCPTAEAKLRLGLLHELAHAEVADSRFSVIAAVAQSVWFFLPQVWWIRSQLRLDAEFLADHRAAEHFGTSYHYAESLVGLAMVSRLIPPPMDAEPRAERSSPAGTVASRTGKLASALLQRIQMLLRCPFEVEDRAPRPWVVGSTLFMIGWTVAASCLTYQDGTRRGGELTWKALDETVFALHLTELEIDSRALENRLFNFQFRLPAQFQLACEVLAEPAELKKMQILGHRLELPGSTAPAAKAGPKSPWRQIRISRDAGGRETVHVDGQQAVPSHRPVRPETWLTIRPIPGRITHLRHLELTW